MIIPVITLWRPWANWVALGWKPIETRTHQRFKSLVGKRIGIHASQKWDECAVAQARQWLTVRQIEQVNDWLRIGGAIICTAEVVSFSKLDWSYSPGALIDCGSTERWGLFLSDVRRIEAIPCKGKQGIWYHDVPEVTPTMPAVRSEMAQGACDEC